MSIPGAPTLFLDVDGVLSPVAAAVRTEDMVNLDAPGWMSSMLFRPLVVAGLRRLHEERLVAIEWLTTWEDEANLYLAGPLGLGPFPVNWRRDAAVDPGRPERGWWKEQVVRARARDGEAFVWLDDAIDSQEAGEGGAGVAALLEVDFPTRGLVVSPDPMVGLTVRDVARVEAFARACADPDPNA